MTRSSKVESWSILELEPFGMPNFSLKCLCMCFMFEEREDGREFENFHHDGQGSILVMAIKLLKPHTISLNTHKCILENEGTLRTKC